MTKEEKRKINYWNIHTLLVKKHGRATHCSNKNCSFKAPKRYEWALKKGRSYSTDIRDYLALCPSCHRKYDDTEERRNRISADHKGKIYHNRMKEVIQCDLSGSPINTFTSIREAQRQTGVIHTAIHNMLAGRAKSAGGFIWKFKQ